ncbi:MAG: response regulator [Nitrospirae bacterium]|nr:response regulator [Nitrospirota bacterium]
MEAEGTKILVVDDDPLVRDMLAVILNAEGYQVETVENGLEAIDKFRSGSDVEVVISDMNMPEMNGNELIREIRKIDEGVPIIILTGNNEILVAINAIRNGANEYLLKDENIQDTLKLSVENVIEKYRLKKQNLQLIADLARKKLELEISNRELRELNELITRLFAQYVPPKLVDEIGMTQGSEDEGDQVTESFHRTIEKMKSYQQNLEDMVSERTAELEKAYEELKQLDEMKSAFLSSVSHELRTPLTSILGFACIIREKLEDTILPLVETDERKVRRAVVQVRSNIDIIVSEGERLTKIINDVLDLAKMEAGKVEWASERTSIAETIERATAATAVLIQQKGLKLIKEVEKDLPDITGDMDKLIQALVNLISNAVKFTDKGTITCRASRTGNEIKVSVIDSGIGIAEEDREKVFEKFKQIGDTLTDKPKGTGLGLPICRQIIEHHGGRIWVESGPGQGSNFSFTIPLSREVTEHEVLDLRG